jgi:hypothetical protein
MLAAVERQAQEGRMAELPPAAGMAPDIVHDVGRSYRKPSLTDRQRENLASP